jgi:hypothetical protein
MRRKNMTSKIKKILASLLALAALALGGAALASATNGGSGGDQGGQEKAENESLPEGADDNGSEALPEGADDQQGDQADQGESVSDAVAAQAEAAAVAKVGGTVQEVNAESNDGPDRAGDLDPGEKPVPAGTAYEVDLTKGAKAFKVALDKQFNVLQVQAEQAD